MHDADVDKDGDFFLAELQLVANFVKNILLSKTKTISYGFWWESCALSLLVSLTSHLSLQI